MVYHPFLKSDGGTPDMRGDDHESRNGAVQLHHRGAGVRANTTGEGRASVSSAGGDDDRALVDRLVAHGTALTGLFIVRAESTEAARAIARGSPHIRYGGCIVVRGIERTRGTR